MYVERIMEYALQTFVDNYLHRKEKRYVETDFLK